MFGPTSVHLLVMALFFGLLAVAVVTDIESICVFRTGSASPWPLSIPRTFWRVRSRSIGRVRCCSQSRCSRRASCRSRPAGVGGGDVKLMAATALWVGPASFSLFVLVTSLMGGVIGVLMLSRFRFVVAQIADTVGYNDIRDIILGRSIPYSVSPSPSAAGWSAAVC